MFSEREKFICILTIFKTSKISQSLPKNSRVALEELYRTKFCPSIDYNEWREIEKSIIKTKNDCISQSLDLMLKAMGRKTPDSKELEEIKQLEHSISLNDNITNIIKTFLPSSQLSENKELNDVVKEIKTKLDDDNKK